MQVIRKPEPLRIDQKLEIPSIPLVLTRILRILEEDVATSKQLEEIIKHDPALAGRILRLSNSAFYSFRSEVKSISHAVSLLGINLVRSLAIGMNIFDSFTKGLRSEGGLINQLWMHSFGVGLISQEIWTRLNGRRESEFAFLCGLLHDLGMGVLFKTYPGYYGKIFSSARSEADPPISTIEFDQFGTDHATVGAAVAKEWGLPVTLAKVLKDHHIAVDSELPLLSVIALADNLARESTIGHDGDCVMTAELSKLRLKLEISEEAYSDLTAFGNLKRVQTEEFFRTTS
jgi:HD-like signal output (HDOD) protein